MGKKMAPITYPIIMIVEENSSLFSFFDIANISHTKMQIPDIKANLDKNKSQRIGILA